MNTVVDLTRFRTRGRVGQPTLVLVDLHDGTRSSPDAVASPGPSEPLANCRAILAHARRCGFPVAFTRQIPASTSVWNPPVYPRWIEGFEPRRCDMIFERKRPSCYASADFSEMADYVGGSYVIAGQVGELSCLSTVIDAFHRDHRVTVISDALISHAGDCVPQGTMHAALAHIISLYAEPVRTRPWILANPRKFSVVE